MQDAAYKRIPVSSPEGVVYALVDADDYDRLAGFKWCLSSGYAMRKSPRPAGVTCKMHREVLGLVHGDGHEADHINRDKLDNRKSNLRVVTRAVNGRNLSARTDGTSGLRGVSWHKRGQKWEACAKIEGVKHYLGLHIREDDAAAAVNDFWVARGYEAPNDLG
jgi:hypothetical protein